MTSLQASVISISRHSLDLEPSYRQLDEDLALSHKVSQAQTQHSISGHCQILAAPGGVILHPASVHTVTTIKNKTAALLHTWEAGGSYKPRKKRIFEFVQKVCYATGVLSWGMATIQDHRSCLQKKMATHPETSDSLWKNVQPVRWTLSMLSWKSCRNPWPQHAPDNQPCLVSWGSAWLRSHLIGKSTLHH